MCPTNNRSTDNGSYRISRWGHILVLARWHAHESVQSNQIPLRSTALLQGSHCAVLPSAVLPFFLLFALLVTRV